MNTLPELKLRARIAVERLRLLRSSGDAAVQRARFANSIRSAFPTMAPDESADLYVRHRMSMRKFAHIKRHLETVPLDGLNDFLDRHVRIEGWEHLEALKHSSAPVIFVTPHYGNFHAGCLKLIKEIGHHKVVNAFYNPPSKNRTSTGFEDLFQRLGYGFNPLFNDDTAVLKALRVLKRGEALTMMPDVFDISGHVLYVPFFGRLIPAMAGTAMFALKSRANVIVGHSCPGEGLSSTLKLGRPMLVERSGDIESDIATLTCAIFRELELQIRSEPEHWTYLPNIGDLLADRLLVQPAAPSTWLDRLNTAMPQFEAVLPEWPAIFEELKSMPLASGGEDKRGSTGAVVEVLPQVDQLIAQGSDLVD
jgi:KDO2-lipid IV(A) lauroyltransferase